MFSKIKSFIVEVLSEALVASVPALIAYVPDVMAALRAEHSAELKRIREEIAAQQAIYKASEEYIKNKAFFDEIVNRKKK